MSESFRRRQAAVRCADNHVDESISGLVEGHLSLQDSGHIQIDVILHADNSFWIATELDDRLDRIADHVALPGREQVNDRAGSSPKRNSFRGGGPGENRCRQTKAG